VCAGGALTNFSCKLRLNFFLRPGGAEHPLHPWLHLHMYVRGWSKVLTRLLNVVAFCRAKKDATQTVIEPIQFAACHRGQATQH